VAQLLEAAREIGSLLVAVVALVYIGLVAVVAVTAVFTSKPSRRKAALDVLRVLWIRRGVSRRGDDRGGGTP
jgi:hypothetical protein